MHDFQEQCQVHGQQCQVRGQRSKNGFYNKKIRMACIIKQLLDSVFVISGIIKVSVSVISLSLRLRLITLASTLIIPDITKIIVYKYHSWSFKIVPKFTRLTAREITNNNFKISLVAFMPNITSNHTINCTKYFDPSKIVLCFVPWVLWTDSNVPGVSHFNTIDLFYRHGSRSRLLGSWRQPYWFNSI